MLILSGSGAPVTYRVVGREPGPVVRPLRPGQHAVDPALRAAVQAAVTRASAADANVARTPGWPTSASASSPSRVDPTPTGCCAWTRRPV